MTDRLIAPIDAISQTPPQVWMTSAFGFGPEDWGYLSFTDPGRIQHVKDSTSPGFLAVIYGSSSQQTRAEERGRLLGVYQCSHVTGAAEQFLSPLGLERKRQLQKHAGQWNQGFQILRAWRTTPETSPHVRDFAPISYTGSNGTTIARHAIQLLPGEARNLLSLDFEEVPVFGTEFNHVPRIGNAKILLSDTDYTATPSRAGPVSQSAFQVRESEGPKHLYILELTGPTRHLLADFPSGHCIVKVGFSKSPKTRCKHFNAALPKCDLKWKVVHSSANEGHPPYPSSKEAISGENAMKIHLERFGRSMGGEFFLADPSEIESAWIRGHKAASSEAT